MMSERYMPVPADSYVTSGFGPRWGTVHRGTDFGRNGGSANMPIYAAQSGTVVYAGAASGFGGPDPAGWVVVDHPTDAGSGTTVYGHIIREVSVGQRVKAGDRIGRVNPNSATNGGVAPHLHFEVHPTVWRAGSQIDPVPWLKGAKTPGRRYTPEDGGTGGAPGGVIFGVDVSEHQDGMSLKQAAREGMKFAIIRTTDGTYRDRTYRSHLDDAESAGLVTAAYHYLRNPSEGTTVKQQVDASLAVMGTARRPVWIDVETPAGLHVDHIRQAVALYKQAGVRVIGAYSYVPYWENKIAPGEPDSHEFGKFWVAAYGANNIGSPGALYAQAAQRQWSYPLGNQLPVLWQFGSNALVCGRPVDINAFKGTVDDLRALFYGTAKPVDKPDVGVPVTEPPTRDEDDLNVEHVDAPAPPKVDDIVQPDHPKANDPVDGKPGRQGRRTVIDVIVEAIVNLFIPKDK